MNRAKRVVNSIFTDNPVRLSEQVNAALMERAGAALHNKKLQVVSEMFDSGEFTTKGLQESVRNTRAEARRVVLEGLADKVIGAYNRADFEVGRAKHGIGKIAKKISKTFTKSKSKKNEEISEAGILSKLHYKATKKFARGVQARHKDLEDRGITTTPKHPSGRPMVFDPNRKKSK